MKRISVFFCTVCTIVALCVVASCEKLKIDEDVQDDSSGNLKVNVFKVEKSSFGTLTRSEKPASEACSRLNFAVYTLDGTRVKQVNQTSDMSDFGSASFQLEEGDYQLVVVGHSSNGNPTMTDPTCIKFTNAQGYSDTFLCSGVVTIGDEPVDMQVSLSRIVSLCRFVITDSEYPAGVTKMRFYYTGGSGAFDANTGLGCVNSKQDVKFDIASGQKQFDLYTFLHDQEGSIHLKASALDAEGNELYNREFDVPMEQNYITWLSGSYFNGSGSSTSDITTVTVETDWDGEKHLTF
ncbi:MAG: FimB/Mfa2 family fimbrial subunit [Prevotella sp.]|nr:FimB/Mfa2 family fimbrial subunit [Prevotella sp.]